MQNYETGKSDLYILLTEKLCLVVFVYGIIYLDIFHSLSVREVVSYIS